MAATTHAITDDLPVRREAPLTLEEPAPRVLGWLDQLGLWGNLGVSLLGPVGAIFVLYPSDKVSPLSLTAALVSVVVGTLLGTLLLGLAAVPGARTGAPSMVLLRGLFGTRVSYVPTALNVLQLVGWGVFEIVIIAGAAQQLLPWHGLRWLYVVVAGVLTTVMVLWPLGSVRVLRRYALAAVAVATAYLFAQLFRHHVQPVAHGSWQGFWLAADVTIAVAVSWVPLASDYSRHSRSPRQAFAGAFFGYSVTQVLYYGLGLLALATVVKASFDQDVLAHDMFAAYLAVPVGWLAFGVLVLRELDQSFADTYSTVVSIQNLRPSLDRRLLGVVFGAVATVLALVLHIKDYQNFLILLGSVFVPMFAVFVTDYFLLGRHRAWNTAHTAPARWAMLLPWLLGFAAYQMVNPGYVTSWASWWTSFDKTVGFTPQTWMSASILSFVVAAVTAVPLGLVGRREVRP